MRKNLILCVPLIAIMAGCSTTRMAEVVPESRCSEFEKIPVQGWNTGSVITYGKNYKNGFMETAGVTVYHDSGIDNATKLAHAAGSVAMGTGSVMQGVGAIRYADAWKKFANDGFHYSHSGLPETNVNVNNSTDVASDAYSDSYSDSYSDATAKSKSDSSADASADIHPPKKSSHGGTAAERAAMAGDMTATAGDMTATAAERAATEEEATAADTPVTIKSNIIDLN